ncbi:hypothetical protein ACQW5G_04815 [Fructilactobacillus sp. Tb1]|uniref:hypothetical protein n=1 Tax=Fructilactobacillus sp. Tb1 TaxID=3422304 RepID=UPI003D28D184
MDSKLREVTFFIGYLFLILFNFIGNTTLILVFPSIIPIIKFLDILAILILLVKIFILDKINAIYIYFIIVIGIIIFITTLSSKSWDLIDAFIVIVAANNVSLKKIFKFSLITVASLLCFTITLSYLNIIPNLIYYRNGIYRQSLGVGYTTILSSMLFYILISFFALKSFSSKKHLIIVPVIVLIISLYLYQLTDTRTDLICEILLIISYFLSDNILKNKIFNGFICVFPTFIGLWSLFSTYLYDSLNHTWNNLDYIFSYRLSLANQASIMYPAKLFGQYFIQMGNGFTTNFTNYYFYIDNSFMRIYFMNGIIAFLLFFVFMQIMFIKVIKMRNSTYTRLLVLFCIASIEGLFSSLYLSIGINSILFLFKMLLTINKKENHSFDLKKEI